MEQRHIDHARIFKALCDERRLAILEMLQSGEKCACVLLERLDIAQPTLSHHMKVLCESGIVMPRKEGKWTYYSISENASNDTILLLKSLTAVTIDETGKMVCCDD